MTIKGKKIRIMTILDIIVLVLCILDILTQGFGTKSPSYILDTVIIILVAYDGISYIIHKKNKKSKEEQISDK